MTQPEVKRGGVENHRHTVMQGGHKIVCCGCQDGKGLDHAVVRSFPLFPQAGQAHGRLVRQLNIVGLLLAVAVRPFEKAGDGDDTAAVLDGVAEGGFLGDALGTGVDQVATEAQVLDQPGTKPHLSRSRRLRSLSLRTTATCWVEATLKRGSS